jgi:hypothetical protein
MLIYFISIVQYCGYFEINKYGYKIINMLIDKLHFKGILL